MTTAPPQLCSTTGGLPSAVRWAHLLMKDRLRPGDAAVDGTAGNGHDTLFLAHLVGKEGKVWAFDIQAAAVTETRRRLADAGVTQAVVFHAGHEIMADHVPQEWQGRLKGIMLNLGYLPGSDKIMTTQVKTTLEAVQAAVQMLAPGGLMTIAVYPGHEDGALEQSAIEAWASSLPTKEYEAQLIRPINRQSPPPECWVVWKR